MGEGKRGGGEGRVVHLNQERGKGDEEAGGDAADEDGARQVIGPKSIHARPFTVVCQVDPTPHYSPASRLLISRDGSPLGSVFGVLLLSFPGVPPWHLCMPTQSREHAERGNHLCSIGEIIILWRKKLFHLFSLLLGDAEDETSSARVPTTLPSLVRSKGSPVPGLTQLLILTTKSANSGEKKEARSPKRRRRGGKAKRKPTATSLIWNESMVKRTWTAASSFSVSSCLDDASPDDAWHRW